MNDRRKAQKDLVSQKLPQTKKEASEWRSTMPVTPLGHRDGHYFFLSKSGQLRSLDPRDIRAKLGIESLFEGDIQWLWERLSYRGNYGEICWDREAAAFWLMETCHDAGIFDENMRTRGLGVWRYEFTMKPDGIAVHCGNRVLLYRDTCNRNEMPLGLDHKNNIYVARKAVEPPSIHSATASDATKLRDAIKLWKFSGHFAQDELGTDLIAGWIGVALLGAAPAWRPHIYVVGEAGSGKSTLAELVCALLGEGGSVFSNNFSEAGLRQLTSGDSRAIILDEAEGNEGSERMQAVIRAIRRMSGGEGSVTRLGTKGGKSQTFTMSGAVYLTSVLNGHLKPQDRSRITVVRLAPAAKGPALISSADNLSEALSWAKQVSPRLKARAAKGFQRFEKLLRVYREVLLERGADARQADQLGTLMAGRDLILSEVIPSDEEARADANRFRPLLQEMAEDHELGNEGQECLQHLLGQLVVEPRSKTPQISMGELLMEALAPSGFGYASDTLRRRGIRVLRKPNREVHVANNHPELEKLFKDSSWSQSCWKDALLYLPGGRRGGTVDFGTGLKQRTTIIPAEFWPSDPDA